MLAKHSGMGVGLCPIGQFNVFAKQLWQDILTSYDNVQVSGPIGYSYLIGYLIGYRNSYMIV